RLQIDFPVSCRRPRLQSLSVLRWEGRDHHHAGLRLFLAAGRLCCAAREEGGKGQAGSHGILRAGPGTEPSTHYFGFDSCSWIRAKVSSTVNRSRRRSIFSFNSGSRESSASRWSGVSGWDGFASVLRKPSERGARFGSGVSLCGGPELLSNGLLDFRSTGVM